MQTYIEQRRYRERGNWDRSFYFSFRPTEPIRHGHVDPLSLFVAYTQLELDKHIPPRLHYSMGILSGPNSTQVTNSFLFLSSSSFYFLIVCRNDLHFHSGPLFFLSFSPGGLLENSRLACCLLNIRATVERKRRLGGFFFFKEKTNMDQTSVSFFFSVSSRSTQETDLHIKAIKRRKKKLGAIDRFTFLTLAQRSAP